MSVELRFEDLVTLALPDIRTTMQKTNIDDQEIIFAGRNSALRDKMIHIHLEWVGNFTDYRAEKNQRAFRELEIASSQHLKNPLTMFWKMPSLEYWLQRVRQPRITKSPGHRGLSP